jgi:hypothetical protein
MYSYLALCMRVHAMVPGQPVYGLVMQRRRVPDALKWGENRDKKTSILQECWGFM